MNFMLEVTQTMKCDGFSNESLPKWVHNEKAVPLELFFMDKNEWILGKEHQKTHMRNDYRVLIHTVSTRVRK